MSIWPKVLVSGRYPTCVLDAWKLTIAAEVLHGFSYSIWANAGIVPQLGTATFLYMNSYSFYLIGHSTLYRLKC
jgi:hypothetical protein